MKRVLTGDSPDAFNAIENPDRVHIDEKVFELRNGGIELPPHTVAIVKLD